MSNIHISTYELPKELKEAMATLCTHIENDVGRKTGAPHDICCLAVAAVLEGAAENLRKSIERLRSSENPSNKPQ